MAVINQAQITSKITTSSGEQAQFTTESNVQRISNLDTDIEITKTATKTSLLPKDVVTITTIITNNADFDITRPQVKDVITQGAQFVAGTLELGGMTFPNYNIVDGFTMPMSIGKGGNELRFSFNIVVDDFVTVDQITDTTTLTFTVDSQQQTVTSPPLELEVLGNKITMLKTADKAAVKTGDELTYTITITNDGIYDNTEVLFTDPIPDSTTFVVGSVKIDDMTYVGYNPNSGFRLNDLNAGDTIKVEFKVTIN